MSEKKLKLPAHKGAEAHKQLMKAWAENPELVFRASVKAGVHNEDGTLTKLYEHQSE